MNYSLIIPFYNEEKNIDNLLDKILLNLNNLKKNNRNFQLILVDDYSNDMTFEKLVLILNISTVLIKHKDNYSQSSAILTGISNSKYDNLITLDGDGQNDHNDIEKILNVYEKGI